MKPVIHHSNCSPDAQLLLKNIDYWEEYLPFDGLVIPVNPDEWACRYGVLFGERIWPLEQTSLCQSFLTNKHGGNQSYQKAIDALATINSRKKFLHNFLPVSFYSYKTWGHFPYDWASQEHWDTTIANVKTIARIAKQGGCTGLFLDPEVYLRKGWNDDIGFIFSFLAIQPPEHHTQEAFDSMRQLLTVRGKSFMNAILEEFPECQIVATHGFGIAVDDITKLTINPHAFEPLHDFDNTIRLPLVGFDPANPNFAANVAILPNARHALWVPFLDGMLAAAQDRVEIVDGFEGSYYYKSKGEFEQVNAIVHDSYKVHSVNPEYYSKHIRVGMGLFPMDTDRHKEFTAEELKESVHLAKIYTDRYVWVWSEKKNFFQKDGDDVKVADHASLNYWPPASSSNSLQPDSSSATQDITDAIRIGKSVPLPAVLGMIVYAPREGGSYSQQWSTPDIGQGSGALAFLPVCMNGDGKTQIVQLFANTNPNTQQSVLGMIVYAPRPDGSYSEQWSTPDIGQGSGALAFLPVCMNGDGKTQIVQLFANTNPNTQQSVLGMIVYAPRPDGSYSEQWSTPDIGQGSGALAFLPVCMNGDGKTQIVQLFGNVG